jgi:hypothetical protein
MGSSDLILRTCDTVKAHAQGRPFQPPKQPESLAGIPQAATLSSVFGEFIEKKPLASDGASS